MADRENVQMAGDYEVMQSFRMGGATMLIGYNPGDATYMTCYQNYDFLGNEHFSEAIGSESYVEIMNVFLQRLQAQTEKVKAFQAGRAIPVTVLGREHFHAVSLSGGKDSTAMLLLMLEQGMPIDMVLTAETGMEFPEMYEHLAKLDEHLYRERGIHLTMLRHPKGFEYLMFEEKKQKPSSIENREKLGVSLAGPVPKSDGVPASSKRTSSTKKSTGSRASIRRSTMLALRQTSRSALSVNNTRWWIGTLQKQRL